MENPEIRPPRLRAQIWGAVGCLVASIALLAGPLPRFLEACFRDYARDVDQPISNEARGQLRFVASYLQKPFTPGSRGMMRQIAALSHMACGLMNAATAEPGLKSELAPLAAELMRRALSPEVSPYRINLEQVGDLGDKGST